MDTQQSVCTNGQNIILQATKSINVQNKPPE